MQLFDLSSMKEVKEINRRPYVQAAKVAVSGSFLSLFWTSF